MPSFSNSLEKAIHSALREANERKHELSTLEHFLFALLKEPDARLVLQACDVDLHSLEKRLFEFIEEELGNLVTDEEGAEAVPTAAFQRVIQRAAIHVTSSGRTEVRGGNVLVSIFAERESNAAFFLQEENLTRSDAVNFIAHGTAKNPEFEGAYDLEQPPKDETEELLTEAEWRARFEQEVPTSRVPRVAIVPKNDPFAFLSYSNKDGDLIEGVQDLLAKSAVSTWWDRDIAPGTAWRPEIAKRLETARVVVTFWTANSVASKPVIEEAATAQTSDKLVHIRLDDSPIPYGFGETQYVDLRDWDGSATHPNFQRVIFAIQDKLGAQTIKFASSRIASSSLLDVVAADGLLTVKDAPANVAPVVVDPSDLEHRLSALRQTMGSMCKMCADNTAFQLPQTLHHCLDALKTASELEPVT